MSRVKHYAQKHYALRVKMLRDSIKNLIFENLGSLPEWRSYCK